MPVEGANNGLVVAGDKLVWLHDSLRSPADVWASGLDGNEPRAITHVNGIASADDVLADRP